MLDAPVREIERVGDLDTAEIQLGIKASGKAFRTLSTILYKDRIRAIIRELSCNAYDAHVVAGCPDRPFEVHLPSALEPFFWVRDFGKALSPKEMETIYGTYFESTKEHSDSMIGNLGLGSKSPLCYTDSFTVTSYYGGKRYHYVIFFNEEEKPVTRLLAEEASNSPSGLEVKIAIAKQQDCSAFCHSAIEVFSTFSTHPIVVGNELYKPLERKIGFCGDGWCFNKAAAGVRRLPIAIMAQVAYPIDASAIPNLPPSLAFYLKRPEIEIQFPNNSLTFMAGRDDLSYDERTCNRIIETISAVANDFNAAIGRQLDLCENDFKARLAAADIDSFLGRSVQSYNYRGTKIDPYYNLKALGIEAVHTKVWRSPRYSRTFTSVEPLLHVSRHIVYVLDDTQNGVAQSRLASFIRANYGKMISLIRAPTPEMREDVLTKLPHVPFKTPDDLKVVSQRQASQEGPYKPRPMLLKLRQAIVSRGEWPRHAWTKTNPPEGGIYIVRRDTRPVTSWANDSDFLSFAFNTRLLSDDDKIYGITKSSLEKLLKTEDADKWVELTTVLKQRAKERLAAYGGVATISNSELEVLRHNREEFRHEVFCHRLQRSGSSLPTGHPLRVFISEYEMLKNHGTDKFSEMCMKLGVVSNRPKIQSLDEQWVSLRTKYPLLLAIQNRPITVEPDHIVAYVAMCDAQRPTK